MSAANNTLGEGEFVDPATPLTELTKRTSTIEAFLEKRKILHVRTSAELAERILETGSASFVVDELIPVRSITIVAGESGLGKSALLYQLALSIATGTPFLGRPTRMGRVLYLDYENGISQGYEIVQRQARFLDLDPNTENLLLWNRNDSAPKFGQGKHTALDIIREMRPDFVIIDSLSAWNPEAEEKNSVASRALLELRGLIGEFGCSFIVVHHLRKPSTKPGENPASLQEDPMGFMNRVRGSRAIINGSDVRLGVAKPKGQRGVVTGSKITNEPALVILGFARVTGEVGPIFASRVLDEEGEPVAYQLMVGPDLLFNPAQESAFERLPSQFDSKTARRVYEKGHQATTDFLKKCCLIGILRKVRRGHYEKVPLSGGTGEDT